MAESVPAPDARLLERARGCLLGLAVGEALGRPLEASTPEQAQRAWEAGPRIATDPGDQAAMAGLLAESLIQRGRLDPRDLSQRLVEWSRGGARDVGHAAARALYLQAQGEPWADAARIAWEESQPRAGGAEALARGAPLALVARQEDQSLVRASLAASAVTHFDPRSRWGAAALNLMTSRSLHGAGQGLPGAILGLIEERHVFRALEAVPTLMPVQLQSRNDALFILQTAAWCALNEADFAAAVRRALGLGGAAPLAGAVTGALAGARFGAASIPGDWLAALPDAARLADLAERLVRFSPGAVPSVERERRNGPLHPPA